MTHEHMTDVRSLARVVHASEADLLATAQLIAGDEPLTTLEDLTDSGAEELMAYLRLFGRDSRLAMDRWLEDALA